MNKGKLFGGLLLSAFIPLLVFYVVFMGPGIAQGRYTLLVSDLNGQYVNYFLYFKNAIAEGDNLFYSFSMLLGGDTVSLLGYYMLSPLNLILLLWPAEKIASGIFWLIAVKVALTGVTSFLFFTRKRGAQFSTLLFSTTYALSGYLFAYFMHVMWLDALYMLPLVIMGLELLVEKKKKVLYIVSLAVAIVICFYTGYMIAGFSLLYFIYLQIKDKKSGKERLGEIGRFAGTSILAAALSAFALLPVLLSHMGNRQGQEEIEYGLLHKGTEFVARLFTGAYNGEQFATGTPQLYCGMFIVFLVVLFFVSSKRDGRKSIAAAVLLLPILLSFFIGALDIVWHGMAMPNSFTHRYAFVGVFAFVLLAEECFSDKRKITLLGVIVSDGILLLLAGLTWWNAPEWFREAYFVFDVAVIIVASVLFFVYKNGKKGYAVYMMWLLLGIQVAQLFVNGKSYIGIHHYDDHSTEGYYAAVLPVVDEVKKEDAGFYRMEKRYFNSNNDAMMFSYNGLSHFSSADKSYIRSFMGNLGYNKNFDFWVYYDKGATKAADSLLGVKYLLSSEPLEGYVEKKQIGNQIMYENPTALEIGTVCSSQVKSLVQESGKPFFNQEKIYDAMIGEKTELFRKYEIQEIRLNNITAGENSYVKNDASKDGVIVFDFIAKDAEPIYMYLPSVYNPGVQLCVNGEDKGEYLTAYHRGIVELGTFSDGERVSVELYLHGSHAGFSDIQIYGLNEMKLTEAVGKLKSQGWNVLDFSSAWIKSEFWVENDESVLFITIPYSKNWKITVDDIPATVTEVMGTLMAVDVPKGEHTIEMKYIPKGVFVGCAVTLGAVLVLLLVILTERKRSKHLAVTDKAVVNVKEAVSTQTAHEEDVLPAKEQENERTFIQKEYKGQCQVCGKQRTEDDMNVWESHSLFEDVKEKDMPVAWNMIWLCPSCKSAFLGGDVSMKYFLPAVLASMEDGEKKQKRFKIWVGEEAKSISYSVAHLRNLQAVLESKDGEKMMEKFRYK